MATITRNTPTMFYKCNGEKEYKKLGNISNVLITDTSVECLPTIDITVLPTCDLREIIKANEYLMGLGEMDIPSLPERYIINERVCVCHWKDGTVTKSFRHESDDFNKELGFLLCCFRHYNADKSNNKLKKMISWIKFEHLKEYLLDMFMEKNNMKIGEAKAYLRDLKVEEPKEKRQFKVGDKVTIRTDLQDCEIYGGLRFINVEMGKFKGKKVTIDAVTCDKYYNLKEDEGKYYFSKEMFEETRKPKHMKEEK